MEIEFIPDADLLFCRVPDAFKSKKLYISRSVFQKPTQSVNWAKYSTEEKTIAEAKNPQKIMGVLKVQIGVCRKNGQQVEHRPIEGNFAHSQIEGEKSSEVQARLRDNAVFWKNPTYEGQLPDDFPRPEE